MDSDLHTGLARVAAAWDLAEHDIKNAEVVRRDLVYPAVIELRYAGRQLVHAMRIWIQYQESTFNKRNSDDLIRSLHQSENHCEQASYDAIDATILYLSNQLYEEPRSHGARASMLFDRSNRGLLRKLREAGELITQSRSERSEKAKIYEDLRSIFVPELIHAFTQATVLRDKKMEDMTRYNLILSVVTGLLSAFVGGVISWVALRGLF